MKIKNLFNTIIFFFIFFFLHLFLLNNFFPITEVFSNKPIIIDDYPTIFYGYYTFKLHEGKLDIYYPFFLAGYTRGSITYLPYFTSDIALYLLFLFSNYSVIIYKFFIFIINLIFPLVMYFAAKNFEFNKKECLIITFLSILIWHFDFFVHNSNYFGDVTFLFSSYLSIFAISLFYRYLNKNKKIYLVTSILLLFYVILSQILSIIILIIPFLLLYSRLYKKNRNEFFIILILLIVFCSAFSFILLQRISYIYKNMVPDIFLGFSSRGTETLFLYLQNDIVTAFIFLFGFSGIYLLHKDKSKRQLSTMLFLTSIFLFIYSFFSFFLIFPEYTTPIKFLTPLLFFLIFPSSLSISSIIYYVKNKINKKYIILFAIIFLLILIFKAPDFYYKSINILDFTWNSRLTTHLPDDVNDLIVWIKTNTSSDARILIEDSGSNSGHQYGGHVLPLIALYTDREFIGGPFAELRSKKVLPHFYDCILSNRNASEYSSEELEQYFELFNIKWIVVWSDECKAFFNEYSNNITKVGQIGRFSLYETQIKPNFFLKGNGNITREVNLVKIINATKGETVIKYRFFDNLKINSNLIIESYETAKIHNFSFEFIEISNGNITDFEIFI